MVQHQFTWASKGEASPIEEEFAKWHLRVHSNFRKWILRFAVFLACNYSIHFFLRGDPTLGMWFLTLGVICAVGVWLLGVPCDGEILERRLLAIIVAISIGSHCYYVLPEHPSIDKDLDQHSQSTDDKWPGGNGLNVISISIFMRGATIQAFFVPLAILFMRFMAFGPVHLLVLFFDGVLSIYVQIRVLSSAAASVNMSLPVANCVNICILQLLLVALCVCFTVLLNNQDRQHLLWIERAAKLVPQSASEQEMLVASRIGNGNVETSQLGPICEDSSESTSDECKTQSAEVLQRLAAGVISESLEASSHQGSTVEKKISVARSTSSVLRLAQGCEDDLPNYKSALAELDLVRAGSNGTGQEGTLRARLATLVESTRFGGIVGFVIFLNALHIAVETDIGESYKDLPRSEDPFFIADLFFNVFYSCEISLRIFALRSDFFSWWNGFELSLVLFGIADMLIALVADAQDMGSLILLRLLRIMKLARMMRVMSIFRELYLLIEGMLKSLRLLFWSIVLLLLLVFVCGVFTTQTIGNADWVRQLEMADQVRLHEHFGTVPRSMYTLFQIQTLESWSEGIVRPIMQHKPITLMFFVPYVMFVTICVLNVIVAIIVESVMKDTMIETDVEKARMMKAARQDMMHQLTALFSEVASDSKAISREDWLNALELPHVQHFFACHGFDKEYAVSLFDIFDVDQSGTADFLEFLPVMLRGVMEVKHFDVIAIQADIWRAHEGQCRLFREMMQGERSTWAQEVEGIVATAVERALSQVHHTLAGNRSAESLSSL